MLLYLSLPMPNVVLGYNGDYSRNDNEASLCHATDYPHHHRISSCVWAAKNYLDRQKAYTSHHVLSTVLLA